MKPNFAAVLSATGLRLLIRATGGWHHVGEIEFTDKDLSEKMRGMLDDAEALATSAITTKLVIPNDHVRYIVLPPLLGDRSDQKQAVETALEGATPYPLSALSYDWTTHAQRSYVAAVARETLNEAESFARTYGLNPVSYVACPDAGQFEGADGPSEPFFGTADAATELLRLGEIVEPDAVPVKVTGTAEVPRLAPRVAAASSGYAPPPQAQASAQPLPPFKIPVPKDAALTEIETRDLPEDPLAAPPRLAGVPVDTNVVALPSDASTLERAMAIAPVTGRNMPTGSTSIEDAIASLAEAEEAAETPSTYTPPSEPPLTQEFTATSRAPTPELEATRDPAPEPFDPDYHRRVRKSRRGRRWILLVLVGALLAMLLALALFVPQAEAAETDLGVGRNPTVAIEPQHEVFFAAPPKAPPIGATNTARLTAQQTAEGQLLSAVSGSSPLRPRLRPTLAVANDQPTEPTAIIAPAPSVAPKQLAQETLAALDLSSPTRPATLPKRTEVEDKSIEIVEVIEAENELEPGVIPAVAVVADGQTQPTTLQAWTGTRPALRSVAAVQAAALISPYDKRPRLRPKRLARATPKEIQAATDPKAVEHALITALAVQPQKRPLLRPKDLPRVQAFNPTRTAKPSGKTAVVAARNATQPRALKIGRVTLLGTMGKTAQKSALVRLNSGKVKRVNVGDRIDGGRIAAIDATTLRYVKKGRTITLKMPQG